jgi:crotonobetainyl-CoA:carnitine CoA-transferase CaiB-like acyl-CoA transferase
MAGESGPLLRLIGSHAAAHRRFFRELDHPEVDAYRAPRPPYTLSECECQLDRAPLLVEHGEYVLKEIAGLSDDEIAELAVEGVVE